MPGTRLAVLVLFLFGVGSFARPAAGNGRFPASVNVAFEPGATERILVPVTFGLLVSSDGGAHFSHVCEAAVGYTGTYDPDYAVARNGAIYATSFDGLRVSRDGACTFEPVAGPLSGRIFVSDLEIGPDGVVWATTATGGTANDVHLSSDGVTFSSVGLERDVWWLSIKTSPSDASRLYLTGHQLDPAAPKPLLLRSLDGGLTWEDLPTGDFQFAAQPFVYLLAVSPADPDLLFARAVGSGSGAFGDALYRSADGGKTWVKALDFADRLAAFVVRRDGRTVIAGSAGPCPGEDAAAPKGCVRISGDGGLSWRAPTSQPKTACIGERSDGALYACGANYAPDEFALARSDDGETWQRVVRFGDIDGPLECPADTAQAECATTTWPALCSSLEICEEDTSRPDRGDPVPDDGGNYYCGVGAASSAAPVPAILVIAALAWSARRRRA